MQVLVIYQCFFSEQKPIKVNLLSILYLELEANAREQDMTPDGRPPVVVSPLAKAKDPDKVGLFRSFFIPFPFIMIFKKEYSISFEKI